MCEAMAYEDELDLGAKVARLNRVNLSDGELEEMMGCLAL